MKKTSAPDTIRQSALAELASLTSIEFGTLSEVYRNKPSADGRDAVRRGPYFKHQCWENGRNRSTYIPSGQVEALRQDLENGKRFQQITGELAAGAIQQSRARRAAAADLPVASEKKTSRPNALPKNTTKRNTSSPKPGNNSRGNKGSKT